MMAVIKHSYIIIIIIISYFFIYFFYFPISYAFQTIQIIWEPILFFKKKKHYYIKFSAYSSDFIHYCEDF